MRVFRRSFILLFLTGALILAGYWDQYKSSEERHQMKVSKTVFSTQDEGDLVGIEVSRDGMLMKFKKNDGLWVLEEPYEQPLNQRKVRRFVQNLLSIKLLKVIPDPGSLDDFGISQPEARIVIVDQKGTKSELIMGIEAPLGLGRYGWVEERQTLGIVSKAVDFMVGQRPMAFYKRSRATE